MATRDPDIRKLSVYVERKKSTPHESRRRVSFRFGIETALAMYVQYVPRESGGQESDGLLTKAS